MVIDFVGVFYQGIVHSVHKEIVYGFNEHTKKLWFNYEFQNFMANICKDP